MVQFLLLAVQIATECLHIRREILWLLREHLDCPVGDEVIVLVVIWAVVEGVLERVRFLHDTRALAELQVGQ